MRRRRLLILGGAIFLAIGGSIGEEIISSSGQVCAAEAKASFADDVMPIFVGRCFSCHKPRGEGNEKSGLDLSICFERRLSGIVDVELV